MSQIKKRSELGLEITYTALVAYPDLQECSEFLKTQGVDCSVAELNVLKNKNGVLGKDLYIQKRKELAGQIEKIEADELLDTARKATKIVNLALDKTQRMLERNEVADPSRTARDINQVMTQSIDKRMLLEDRPTEIRAVHTTDELVLKLSKLGVLEVDSGVVDRDVIEASVVEDPS